MASTIQDTSLAGTAASTLTALAATRRYLRDEGYWRHDLDQALDKTTTALTFATPAQTPQVLAHAVTVLRTCRDQIGSCGPDWTRSAYVADGITRYVDACERDLAADNDRLVNHLSS